MASDDFEIIESNPSGTTGASDLRGFKGDEATHVPVDFVDREQASLDRSAKYVVSMVPGIRDLGLWIDNFAFWSQQRGVRLISAPVNVRRVSTLPFLFRIGSRKRELDVLSQLLITRLEHPDAKHYIIAHSYGTEMVGRIIDRIPCGYQAIFLCASVTPTSSANNFTNKSRKVFNDCSLIDKWPWMAELINPISYEATGTYGMRASNVLNRFHNHSHSDYTKKEHFEKYLLSSIVSDTEVNPSAHDANCLPCFTPTYGRRILVGLIALIWLLLKFFHYHSY